MTDEYELWQKYFFPNYLETIKFHIGNIIPTTTIYFHSVAYVTENKGYRMLNFIALTRKIVL